MIHRPLSTPAKRVEAPHELNTMKFSRTLDERNPYTRSGSAWIVPMVDDLQREFNASTYVIAFILVIAVFVVVGFA
jgi:hypothetical protein